MTIYNATTGRATVIDAIDMAPNLASRDMYGKDQSLTELGTVKRRRVIKSATSLNLLSVQKLPL